MFIYEWFYYFLCFLFLRSPPSLSIHQSSLSGLELLRWLSRNDGLCLGINEDSIRSLDTKYAAPPSLFINLLFFSCTFLQFAHSFTSLLWLSLSIFTVLTARPFAPPLLANLASSICILSSHACCVLLLYCSACSLCVCVCASVCVSSYSNIFMREISITVCVWSGWLGYIIPRNTRQ